MSQAFVSAGSNIDPEINIRQALCLLVDQVRVTGLSTVYLTEPINRPGQPAYYNTVIKIETTLPPRELKTNVLKKIEERLGRLRSNDKFAARTIDLDLILYDTVSITEEELVLPDPDILQRPFLVMGLVELAPDLILPNSKLPLAEIAGNLRKEELKPLELYTARLRGELKPWTAKKCST